MASLNALPARNHASPLAGNPAPTGSLLQGSSPATEALRRRLAAVAPFFRTALICGEAGVGKHQVARELHRLRCSQDPFYVVRNTSEVDVADRLRSAHGGVVFFPELAAISRHDQAWLVAILNGPSWKGGADHERAKILAATRSDPKLLLATGKLDPALYDLLATVNLLIRPLRERREDIPELAHALLADAAPHGDAPGVLTAEDLHVLQSAPWPGNVAQLRLCVLHQLDAPRIALPEAASGDSRVHADCTGEPERLRLQDVVQAHVCKVLSRSGGNKLRAAELLGVSRSTLYRMLDEIATSGAV